MIDLEKYTRLAATADIEELRHALVLSASKINRLEEEIRGLKQTITAIDHYALPFHFPCNRLTSR